MGCIGSFADQRHDEPQMMDDFHMCNESDDIMRNMLKSFTRPSSSIYEKFHMLIR